MPKPALHLTRPADRSLAAYRAWVRALVPGDLDDDLTPAEWDAAWRAFWASAPAHEANRGIDTLPAARPAAAP